MTFIKIGKGNLKTKTAAGLWCVTLTITRVFQKATANWHYFIKYHRHFKLSQWDDTFLEKVWYCPTDGVRCLIEREASTKWKSPYLFSPYKNSEQSPDLCGWRVWNFEKLRDRKGTVDTEVLFFYWQWGDYTWSFFQYFLVIIQSVINFSLSELRLKKNYNYTSWCANNCNRGGWNLRVLQ